MHTYSERHLWGVRYSRSAARHSSVSRLAALLCVCVCVCVPVDVGIGFVGLPLAVCHQRQEAIPDGGGSLTGELLVDDSLGQALKVAEG